MKKALLIVFCICTIQTSGAQNLSVKDTATNLTLEQCVDYALQHQPFLQQSIINISIARATNAVNLAAWLPQVNVSVI